MTVYNKQGTSGRPLQQTLQEAHAVGMGVLAQIDPTWVQQARWEQVRAFVVRYRTSRGLYGYYLFDEPELFGVSPVRLRTAYDVIRQSDPLHPIAVAFGNESCSTVGASYLHIPDIVLFDAYPVHSQREYGQTRDSQGVYQIPGLIDDCLRLLRSPPARRFRGFIPVLQAFSWQEPGDREPTYRESRFMFYSALIRPVLGVQHWVDYRATPRMTRIVEALDSEARSIARALIGGRFQSPNVSVRPRSISYKLSIVARRLILIAVNEVAGPKAISIRKRRVKILLPVQLRIPDEVRVLFDGYDPTSGKYLSRTLPVHRTGRGRPYFVDDFAPYDVHIYEALVR